MTTATIIGAILTALLLYRLISKKTVDKNQTEIPKETLTPQDFVDKYNKKQGLVKGGSLCFFGHWFGKPYDNCHRLEVATFSRLTNTLTLTFNEKETLTISNPQGIFEYENKLTIGSADQIYWKWYSYGKPQTNNNQYFIEIVKHDNTLSGKTNTDWYKEEFKDLNLKSPALLWS